MSVLEAVPSILAPLLYNQIYALTVRTMRIAVFLAIAAASLGAYVLLYTSTTTTTLASPENLETLPAATTTSTCAVSSPLLAQNANECVFDNGTQKKEHGTGSEVIHSP